MTFEGSFGTIAPAMTMRHFPFSVIRPLCLVPEILISEVAEEFHFERQKTLCPYERASRRDDMTVVFRTLERMNPEARYSMWRAMESISSHSQEKANYEL